MKTTPFLRAALGFAIGALALPAGLAQQPNSDVKLLHNVSAVLQSDKAFRGEVIVPKVSHGVVTLTGTVSSQGDKELASMEVGQVDGVKTVLNNLDVRNGASAAPGRLPALANPEGAQAQQLAPNAPIAQAAPEFSAKTVTVPVNTPVLVRLADDITTKTAKADDPFHGTVAADVYAGGAVAIPAGTPVLGRVVSAKRPGHFIAAAELSLELMTIRLPQPGGKSENVAILTEYLSSNGKTRGGNTAAKTGGGAAAGAIIGALAGGGTGAAIGAASGGALGFGANAVTSGGQIELRPEAVLRFQTAAPLSTNVFFKNGVQMQLPPATGQALKVRNQP